jgi:hypothetical protein
MSVLYGFLFALVMLVVTIAVFAVGSAALTAVYLLALAVFVVTGFAVLVMRESRKNWRGEN